MADTTISSLNTVNALSANNFIPISDGTNTTKLGTDSLFGFRNRIINGDMRIDQRNNGQPTTWTSSSGYQFFVDRYRMATIVPSNTWGQGVITGQRVEDAPPGFNYSAKFTVITSDPLSIPTNVYCIIQPIEVSNVFDLKYGSSDASPVTISFWVKSSLTGTFSLGYRAQTVGGLNNDYHYITEYTINNANTWEFKSVTIPGFTLYKLTTTNNASDEGVAVFFDLGCGSNSIVSTKNTWVDQRAIKVAGSVPLISTTGATLQITGLQLEKGSTATPFEFRPIGTELALCQRYFYKLSNSSANQTTLTFVNSYAGNRSFGGISIPVTMRNVYPITTFNKVTLRSSGFSNDYNVSELYAYDRVEGNIISLEARTASSVLGTGNFFHLNLLNGNTGGTSFIAFETEL